MNFLYRNALPILLLAGISTMLAQQIPTTGPSLPTPGQSAPQPPTSKPGPAPSGPTPLQQLPGSNGEVTGSVADEGGNPVANARVFISQALPAKAGQPAAPPVITGPQMGSSTVDSHGRFTAFLPPGNYVACGQTKTQGFLDPCHFASSAPTFTVVKGQIVSGVKVVLAQGAVLPIHIADPNGLLTAVTGSVASDCRVQMVTSKGYRYEAVVQAQSATGRDYAITVPFGASVTLQVISPNLTVNDGSSGAPVSAAGKSVAAPIAASAPAAPTVTFTVVGAKQ